MWVRSKIWFPEQWFSKPLQWRADFSTSRSSLTALCPLLFYSVHKSPQGIHESNRMLPFFLQFVLCGDRILNHVIHLTQITPQQSTTIPTRKDKQQCPPPTKRTQNTLFNVPHCVISVTGSVIQVLFSSSVLVQQPWTSYLMVTIQRCGSGGTYPPIVWRKHNCQIWRLRCQLFQRVSLSPKTWCRILYSYDQGEWRTV